MRNVGDRKTELVLRAVVCLNGDPCLEAFEQFFGRGYCGKI